MATESLTPAADLSRLEASQRDAVSIRVGTSDCSHAEEDEAEASVGLAAAEPASLAEQVLGGVYGQPGVLDDQSSGLPEATTP